jgi:hypothetical protein
VERLQPSRRPAPESAALSNWTTEVSNWTRRDVQLDTQMSQSLSFPKRRTGKALVFSYDEKFRLKWILTSSAMKAMVCPEGHHA